MDIAPEYSDNVNSLIKLIMTPIFPITSVKGRRRLH